MYPAPQQFDQRLRELIEETISLHDQLEDRAAERSEPSDLHVLAPQPSC